ncbi:MAG: Mitochondrial PGP phosphatase [Tenericutes bacterium ADurb.Bin087]|nr:MAG: Mitochondrial PGP phosphatase [Tenericutes bacterium ADurb.Bin087]
MKKFTPTYYAKNIYEVSIDFFKEQGIKTLLVDLDNTLASYRELEPSAKTINFVRDLEKAGIKVLLASNNSGKRVKRYGELLGVPYIAGARKPFAFKLRKFLQHHGADLATTLMVGDQILTDVFCGNTLGVKIMLTDKLVAEDQWTTRINRLIDRPLRNKLRRKGKLKEWKEDDRKLKEN